MKLSLSLTLLLAGSVGASTTITSTSKLPMSLSAVISDMEADHVEQVSTVTFVASKLFRRREEGVIGGTLPLLEKLIKCDPSEIEEGCTALATTNSKLAFAFPKTPQEALACADASQGHVLYVTSKADLMNGTCNAELLAPVVERVLNRPSIVDNKPPFCVVVYGAESDEMDVLQSKFQSVLAPVMSRLVQPSLKTINNVQDVFDVSFYPASSLDSSAVTSVLTSSLVDPGDAKSTVASIVSSDVGSLLNNNNAAALTPSDLIAVEKLFVADTAALDPVLEEAKEAGSLLPNFGQIVDAAVQRSISDFDKKSNTWKDSAVTKRKRKDLSDGIIAQLEPTFQAQLQQLRLACFENFRKSLSSLRIGPNLPKEMDEKIIDSVKEFQTKAKGLLPSKTTSTWSIGSAKAEYRTLLKEFCTERLQVARSSGAFKPLPRKAISVGLHWLIPKPFGNDGSTAAYPGKWDPNNVVYTPIDKRKDVSPDEVREGTGDWRDNVNPSLAGSDMVYSNN